MNTITPYEEALCETEENVFSNEINPIKLADLDWSNDYKLSKLYALQTQNILEMRLVPEQIFGSLRLMDRMQIEECFIWFNNAREYIQQRTSQRNNRISLASSNFSMNGAEDRLNPEETDSSEDDLSFDETEKFRNTIMKSHKKSARRQVVHNLLLSKDKGLTLEEHDENVHLRARRDEVIDEEESRNEESMMMRGDSGQEDSYDKDVFVVTNTTV